jgi:GTP-binding protein HflX
LPLAERHPKSRFSPSIKIPFGRRKLSHGFAVRNAPDLADPKREKLKVKQRRGILVAVVKRDEFPDKDTILDELKGLASTAGVVVVGEIIQYRDRPHPATCLGTGKLEELQQLIEARDAELVVFDNNLTPAQGKNIEEATDTVIVDRSEVILDIFATHARTHEAMLQVELAQLLYFRTRLKRMWTHLERIEGGIGTGRGPGEKQLETDRRLIDRRVTDLRRKLESVEKRRERTVSNRKEQTTVSLVGYTNAGKSTLMRRLTGADVLIADKLFATLDTRTRRWTLPNWGEVLLSDTVGFVRNLPHHLVASFRSTLEEARQADLLLHVVDASHPQAESQIATVYKVLEEIGIDCTNVLLVLNKADKADRSLIDVLRVRYRNTVTISAVAGQGIEQLAAEVADRLGQGYVDAVVETTVDNGRLFAWLAEHGEITDRQYEDSVVRLTCRLPHRFYQAIPADNGATTARLLNTFQHPTTSDSTDKESA